jgi:omega-amidase
MRVLVCQFNIAWEDKPTNFSHVSWMIEEAQPAAGSLLVLPEMFATGFSMNVGKIAESKTGKTWQFLSELAQRWNCFVIGGVATRSDFQRGRNEALCFGPDGKELARYCKQQPFTLGGERDCYEAGDDCQVVQCGEFAVSPLICYDLRFPELFRTAVRSGAQVLAVIANWPQSRDAHWSALLRARAIENQAYVVGANRCGDDPRLKYSGKSVIFDPQGHLLTEANGAEVVLQANLDLKELIDYRRKFPALADMK